MDVGELGGTVRRWRARVTPDVVGLPAGTRRRTAGLRREELAALAGISADYLTRLEQGRATSPSAQVVESLARALRLPDPDRALLHELAGYTVPGPGQVPSRITPSVQRLLDRLVGTPVAVYDAAWTLLAANPPYDALMGDTTRWQGVERNSVWRHLVGPGTRAVLTATQRAALEVGLVADLRRTAARYPADPCLRRLIGTLTAASPRFARLWVTDTAATDRQLSKRKVIDHPSVGLITVDCDILLVAADDVRLMIYSADPADEDADRLALAVVLGIQDLVR
ncbi:transcriptional regulator with XRE-family HTH domain [Nakamurella sp. UYEF19]|uniref:helix-turn-helix transcriptional regulator n=1 Tax=Nakamurella sp. UYEF19 TaxID=1756392 RepID=UPI003399F2D5